MNVLGMKTVRDILDDLQPEGEPVYSSVVTAACQNNFQCALDILWCPTVSV